MRPTKLLLASIIYFMNSVIASQSPNNLKLIEKDFETPVNFDELKLIKFDQDYNIHSYPTKGIKSNQSLPLEVEFQINLRNVLEVNEVSQICTLETTIRLYWQDSRVKLRSEDTDEQYITLNPRAARHFWIPDIFIDQVGTGTQI